MPKNLETLARQAGVAVSTVSRALAGKPGVSQQTRTRILHLAQQLGVVPDPAARSLRSGEGTGLAVLIPSTTTLIAALRSQALFRFGREHFGVVRVIVVNEGLRLEQAVREALSQNCRAIIVNAISGTLSEELCYALRQRRVPLATVDATCNYGDIFSIDRSSGTFQAARLLLLNGCRHVAVFSATPLDKPDSRLQGLLRGFQTLGRQLSPNYLIPVNGGFESGYRAMRDLAASRPLDGAFCYSDDTACGALRALAEAGIRVPEDVHVIGFDNLEYAAYGTVPLTTVAQPVDDVASAAVQRCLFRLNAFDAPPQQYTFRTHLVVRRSAPILRADIRSLVFAEEESVQ